MFYVVIDPRLFYSPTMLRLIGILFLFATTLYSQSTKHDIETRLHGNPLFLRGLWQSDNLNFDASGHLTGPSSQTSFTLAGFELRKVSLNPDRLTLEGRRVGIIFNDYKPKRVVLKSGSLAWLSDEKVVIEIAAPPDADYTKALDTVFATLTEIAATLPLPWRGFAGTYLTDNPSPSAPPTATPHSTNAVRRVGGDVVAPKVISSHEPVFTSYARALKHAGKVLVYLQVDTHGIPDRVAILRPTGLGLDENAVEAVKSYRFEPATQGGSPVRVELNIEVAYDIFY